MSKIKNLTAEYIKENGLKFISENNIEVLENVEGFKLSVQRIGDTLVFYKSNKSIIDDIDITLFSFLDYPINFFSSMDIDIFPEKYRFNFEYFFNNSPGNIKYDYLPINKLVITHISIINDSNKTIKVINYYEELLKWSKLFNVGCIEPIFQGKLEMAKINLIESYIKKQEEPLSYFIFNTLFNLKNRYPYLKNGYSNIDSIIFRVGNEVYKIDDPITSEIKKIERDKKMQFSNDAYSIFIIDLMNYIENFGFSADIESTSPEKRYIDIMCNIFNSYLSYKMNDIINMDFEHKSFLDLAEFSINVSNIKSLKTIELIQDKKLERILKIILFTFRKKKKNANYIFSSELVYNFNLLIDKINDLANSKPSSFLSFSDFIKK